MSGAPRTEELRLLVRVARMYHEEGARQAQIAAHLSISQPRVSRLLKRATDAGIVRTVVVPPAGVHADLEDRLRTAYDLRDAVIVDAADDVTPALGAATAAYLDSTIARGERVGISSWSATLMAAADAFQRRTPVRAEEISQLVGGLGNPGVQVRATRLTARLADLTGARAVLMPVPGLLRSAALREALTADPAVCQVMSGWRKLSMALVGIGGGRPSALLEQSGNAIGTDELRRLRQLGAVGDICFRFFDAEGTAVPSELDGRILGITPRRFREIDRRVGVAGGAHKHAAIRAALRGGWLNVLITDLETARRLVDQSEPRSRLVP